MHARAFREFEQICVERGAVGRVLEVGAVPSENSLLCMPALRSASVKVGINLDGPARYADFDICAGHANDLPFADATFDLVLCNAVLEHDPFFWKSIAEIRRVTRPGGLVVIGTPGYGQFPSSRALHAAKIFASKVLWRLGFRDRLVWLLKSTPTIEIHDAPGDFYRFSCQAYRDVLFAGMEEVEVRTILSPPVVIGAGRVPRGRT